MAKTKEMAKPKEDDSSKADLSKIKLHPRGKGQYTFGFLCPYGDENYQVNAISKIGVIWKGGPIVPYNARLLVVDIQAWACIYVIFGSQHFPAGQNLYQWTIPTNWLQQFNHRQVCLYIDTPSGDYCYSQNFLIS